MTQSTEPKVLSLSEVKDHFASDDRFTVKEESETAIRIMAKGKRKMNVLVFDDGDQKPLVLSFNISKDSARVMYGVADFDVVGSVTEWAGGKIN